jgi:hypothetical protein
MATSVPTCRAGLCIGTPRGPWAPEGIADEVARPYRLNPQSQKLAHAVAVRDLAVSFMHARANGLLTVTDIRLDSDLVNRSPFREARLVPDVLVTIDDGGVARIVMCEVNCAGQPLAQVRQKVLAYVRARAAGLPLFSAKCLLVLVVAEEKRRLTHLAEYAVALGREPEIKTCLLHELSDSRVFTRAIGCDVARFRPAS